MVSALPQRSENSHHVSMIENYPATLEVLGEPIRQVGGVTLVFFRSAFAPEAYLFQKRQMFALIFTSFLFF